MLSVKKPQLYMTLFRGRFTTRRINMPSLQIRSGANSVIKLRLADILLLKAEAHAALGQVQEAATLVNQVRTRVKLAPIATTLSQEAMKEAVLKERRLELAFEGHRWFDLVRNDAAISTMNTLNNLGFE